jgi:hypothetical protein
MPEEALNRFYYRLNKIYMVSYFLNSWLPKILRLCKKIKLFINIHIGNRTIVHNTYITIQHSPVGNKETPSHKALNAGSDKNEPDEDPLILPPFQQKTEK